MDASSLEPPSDGQILNEESTLVRLKGDKELLITLYRVFIGDLPKKLDAINTAADQKDLNSLQRSAHSLKGASATVGAEALREAALSLEMASKNDNAELAGAIIPKLKAIADKTREMIKKSL